MKTTIENVRELAEIAHNAYERFAAMGLAGIPSGAEERKNQAIEYAVARAEKDRAANKLSRAQDQYAET